MNRLLAAVANVGLVVATSTVLALEPNFANPRAVHNINVIPGPGDHSGIPKGANTCPADNVGTLTSGDTIVGSTIDSTDDFTAPCGSNAGGQDEIFEFAVDGPGEWSFDSCTVPACWDTTLSIHEETGGGCPGDVVACDGDGCPVCYYDSLVHTFLVPTSTYYLIVDGWSTFAYGDFTITALLVVPGCTSDAGCDDGDFCNGAETCDVATGQCQGGSNPCASYEGYSAPCDAGLGACVKPDDCFTWIADKVGSGYFFPQANSCPGTAAWIFDDVQNSHHTTGFLDYYTTPIVARSTPAGAMPLGTVFLVNQALFTVKPGICIPLAEIAGSQCTGAATIDQGGSPPHLLPCSGTMPELPNNSGDFNVCEIDFWMAFRTSENGAGMLIAGNKPVLGGPAAADDFGVSVIALEDCPPTSDYSTVTFFGDDANLPADFEDAVVCQKPGGWCCHPDASCTLTSEGDCDGEFGFTGTVNGTDGGCGDEFFCVRPVVVETAPTWGHFVQACIQSGQQQVCCPERDLRIDPWKTVEDDSCHDFGNPAGPQIPADFFGPGSDPFTGIVCFEGVPLGVTEFGDFGNSDTLIKRIEDPFGLCDPVSAADSTVDIEIVALSLASSAPMTVTFNGGQDPEQWNVSLGLSDQPQPIGTLVATKTHCNGGTYDSELPAKPKFTFSKASAPAITRVLDDGSVVTMTASGTPWVHVIPEGFESENPICSDFHPGIKDPDQTTDDCTDCVDNDSDGIPNRCDNCPDDFNPGQGDSGLATTACCLDGGCIVLNPDCCLLRGGVPQGAGASCGDGCGSCCLADKDCLEDLVESTCSAVGGSFNGVGSSCLGDSDGDGIDNLCDNCPGVNDAVFGTFICDSGSVCATDADCAPGETCKKACVGRIPAVSEWGLVILALLLLAGGKVYFNRRRRATT